MPPKTLNLDKLTDNEKFLYSAGLHAFAKWKITKALLMLSVLGNIALCVGWWWYGH